MKERINLNPIKIDLTCSVLKVKNVVPFHSRP